jgi:predicted Rdx family selenoprotein
MGKEEDCSGFALHIRGGNLALGVVGAILQALNLRALDPQTGGFFALDAKGNDALHRWRAYRDQIVNGETS